MPAVRVGHDGSSSVSPVSSTRNREGSTACARIASPSSRTGSSMPSSVSWKQPKCVAMLSFAAKVQVCAHGVVGIHVLLQHEPARLVSADRQQRDIHLAATPLGPRRICARNPCRRRNTCVRLPAPSITNSPHSVRLRSYRPPRPDQCCAGVQSTRPDACGIVPPASSLTRPSPCCSRNARFPRQVTNCG